MQHLRVSSPILVSEAFDHEGFQQEADLRFLVLALRWLDEAAIAVQALTGDGRLARALEDYERALPSVRDMRDIGEHLGDYVRGVGHLQRGKRPQLGRGAERDLGVRQWQRHENGDLEFIWAGTRIEVDNALAAAQALYAAVVQAELPGPEVS